MAIFGWFKKGGAGGGEQQRSFRLEWSGLAAPPSDGDRRGVVWPDVEALLRRFLGEPASSDAFFILGVSELTYFQAAWESGTIKIEYQEGSTDHHFSCTQPTDGALVLELARLYMDNPESVGGLASWEPMEM